MKGFLWKLQLQMGSVKCSDGFYASNMYTSIAKAQYLIILPQSFTLYSTYIWKPSHVKFLV